MKTLLAFILSFFAAVVAFAQGVPVPVGDFLTQVVGFIQGFGGLSAMAKISGVIVLLIASMKVTALNDLIWAKLGQYKLWVAPLLGLIAGLLSQGSGITLASAFAFISAGVGAVALHELLDVIKVIPGLGSVWVSIISAIESLLGGPASKQLIAKK